MKAARLAAAPPAKRTFTIHEEREDRVRPMQAKERGDERRAFATGTEEAVEEERAERRRGIPKIAQYKRGSKRRLSVIISDQDRAARAAWKFKKQEYREILRLVRKLIPLKKKLFTLKCLKICLKN